MSRLSDLVRDSKLEVVFQSGYTIHTFQESSSSTRQRPSRQERWYREKQIGAGSFGSLWLERCVEGQKGPELRAVKQIQTSLSPTRSLDCTGELEAIAKFSHEKYEHCFVKSFGWYQDSTNLYISLEYLEFGDLHAYLVDNEVLSEQETREIVRQTLEGLYFMHSNEYAHRDLKPNNVLIKSCPPEPWWIKIADFGISKRIETQRGGSTTMKGTLAFMAPETHGFTSRGSVYAVDIWALGEMSFQMLTKRPTFPNLGFLALYVQGLQEFPSKILLDHNISLEAVGYIQSMMDPLPATRLTTLSAKNHSWVAASMASSPIPFSERTTGISSQIMGSNTPTNNAIQSPISISNQSASDNITSFSGTIGTWTTAKEDNNSDSQSTSPSNRTTITTPLYRDLMSSTTSTISAAVELSPQIPQSTSTLHVKSFEAHNRRIDILTFSRDGLMVATRAIDNMVRIWDTKTENMIHEIEFDGGVWSLAFSPCNKMLACSFDEEIHGNITIYNMNAKSLYPSGLNDSHTLSEFCYSPDGSKVAGLAEGVSVDGFMPFTDVLVWEMSTGKLIYNLTSDIPRRKSKISKSLRGFKRIRREVFFSPDGAIIAAFWGGVTLWDPNNGSRLITFQPGASIAPQFLAFSLNSRMVFVGDKNDHVMIFDTKTRECTNCYFARPKHGEALTLSISPDGNTIIRAGDFPCLGGEVEGWIYKYAIKSGEIIETHRPRLPFEPTTVNTSHDGKIIGFGGGSTVSLCSW